MRGKIIALILMVTLLGSPARSENWRPSSGTGEVVAYIETDAIRRRGNREVQFWRQLRWPQPQTLPNGVRFDRAAALLKADCLAMSYISLWHRLHLGDRMVFDGKDDNREVHVVEPGSTGEADLLAACFDEWKTGK